MWYGWTTLAWVGIEKVYILHVPFIYQRPLTHIWAGSYKKSRTTTCVCWFCCRRGVNSDSLHFLLFLLWWNKVSPAALLFFLSACTVSAPDPHNISRKNWELFYLTDKRKQEQKRLRFWQEFLIIGRFHSIYFVFIYFIIGFCFVLFLKYQFCNWFRCNSILILVFRLWNHRKINSNGNM